MSLLSLKIVTPEKLVVNVDDLNSVSIPTVQGEITVLPNHIPLVTNIAPGELIYRLNDKEVSLVVTGGFLKLNSKGQILILADHAVRSDDLELEKIKEAKEKAEKAMQEKKSEKEFIIAETELRKTLLELKIASKKRTRH